MKPTPTNRTYPKMEARAATPQESSANKPKKQYGMDGEYTPDVPYRNDAQKYDQYPNPSANSLKISKGDTLDKVMKSNPMNEQQRLEVMGKPKPSDYGTSLKVKSGSKLSNALNKAQQ